MPRREEKKSSVSLGYLVKIRLFIPYANVVLPKRSMNQ